MNQSETTIYDFMGGAAALHKLVDSFYDRVSRHPVLRPLFPDDFTEIREKQYQFLTQFFGGPPLFSQAHGAPMLRARHIRIPIEPRHAAAWFECMQQAVSETIEGPALRDVMLERLSKAAYHMVNRDEHGGPLDEMRVAPLRVESSDT